MDLRVLLGVMLRHRGIVALGVAAAAVLATLSYARPVLNGTTPGLEPRKEEVWQASVTLFLTQSGFPAGRTEQPLVTRKIGGAETTVAQYADPGRFTSLAPLYARLANSDEVRKRVIRSGGPLGADVKAIPTADTTYGTVSGLPMITVIGTAPTRRLARTGATRVADGFTAFLVASQTAAKIPRGKRVVVQVLNAAGNDDTLIVPRKKTLPIVVFLAVLCAAVALAFIRENAASRERQPETVVTPPPAVELPRTAAEGATSHRQRWRSSSPRPGA